MKAANMIQKKLNLSSSQSRSIVDNNEIGETPFNIRKSLTISTNNPIKYKKKANKSRTYKVT